TVDRLSPNNTAGTLIIRSADSGAAANFNVSGVTGKRDQQPSLVFHRYGSQYFLAKIFYGQGREGYGLLKSKTERELAKKSDTITQNVVEPETVAVAAQIGR